MRGERPLIRLQVVAVRGHASPEPRAADFDELGGTIGRGDGNALVLPDPDRHISRVHAAVVLRGGRFAIADRSAALPIELNGVSVGQGGEAPIVIGDRLRVGDYMLAVAPVSATAPPQPVREREHGEGMVGQAPMVPAAGDRTASRPLPGATAPAPSVPPSPEGEPRRPLDGQPPFADLLAGLADVPAVPTTPARASAEKAGLEAPLGAQFEAPATSGTAIDFDVGSVVPGGRAEIDALFGLQDGPMPTLPALDPSHPLASRPSSDVLRPSVPEVVPGRPDAAEARAANPAPARVEAVPAPAIDDALTGRVPLPGTASASDATQRDRRGSEVATDPVLRAFLEGAGVPHLDMGASMTPALAGMIGRLLRETTQGTLDLLVARAIVRRELRTANTLLGARDNNDQKANKEG